MTATPLPEPAYAWRHEDMFGVEVAPATPLFSADQMREHELAGYKRGLAAVAKVCEIDESGRDSGGYFAEIIRALGEQK